MTVDIRALIAANRSGRTVGLPSFCTANEHVLRACLDVAATSGVPSVVEATCNQVNQDGGYTGMRPADFARWLKGMAEEAGVAWDRVLLGGDHLGPNPWRREGAETAMAKARVLVRDYVRAGFTKIHLDASMACGGEPMLDFETIAERAADLCAVAEDSAPDPEALVYVIGTEVPIPGGERDEPAALDVTSVARFDRTIATHREAFAKRGLEAAWDRIVSIVTQPGVDFGHTTIYPFAPERAHALGQAVLAEPGLTFEAHSTDYQSDEALRALVDTHFFFLKVGPELTFRFREAVLALAAIEAVMRPAEPSRLRETLDRRMDADDAHWRDYYRGEADEIARLKLFSYSDRIRYYWTDPEVAAALSRLLANLRAIELPASVVSQYFTCYAFGDVETDPDRLIRAHVTRTISRYYEAAGTPAA